MSHSVCLTTWPRSGAMRSGHSHMRTSARNSLVQWAGMSAFLELRTLRAQAGTLTTISNAMIHLAADLPDRATLGQMVFFLTAARADLEGEYPTFGNIQAEAGPIIGKSIQGTYKLFLEGRRQRGAMVEGLGWLAVEPDPSDRRHKVFRLTPKGREVVEGLQAILAGQSGNQPV